MSPLAVVAPEVGPAGLRGIETLTRVLKDGGTADLVWLAFMLTRLVGLNIRNGLLRIAGNIKSVARSLRDGETEVQGNATGNGTKTDDNTPHLVNS